MKKRLLANIFMISTLAIGTITNASPNYVPTVQIVSELQNLIEEYDFEDEIKIEQCDVDNTYTYAEVEEELSKFEEELKNRNSVNEIILDSSTDDILTDDALTDDVLMNNSIMTLSDTAVTGPKSVSKNIQYTYGHGVWVLSFEATVDSVRIAEHTVRRSITNIENIKASQEGIAVNLDSWEQDDEGYTLNVPNGTADIWVDLRIVSSKTILGQKLSDSGIYRFGTHQSAN